MSLLQRLRWLPVAGFICTNQDTEHNNFTDFLKLWFHGLYTIAFVGAIGACVSSYLFEGVWNPIEATRIGTQRKEERQIRIEKVRERKNNLAARLFGKDGMADTNHDGAVDDHEMVDFYHRLGLEKNIRFEWPFCDDCSVDFYEKAIESYQSGR